MPKIETWDHLPVAVRKHLIARMRDRVISLEDLDQLRLWIESKPEVPEGDGTGISGSFKLWPWAISQDVPAPRPGCQGFRRLIAVSKY